MKLYSNDEWLWITIETHTTLDNVLTQFQQSKKNRYVLYTNNCIFVNEVITKQSIPLHPNDLLSIYIKSKEQDEFTPMHAPLSILYEDDLFLIVDKPVSMLVHPDGKNTTSTLANLVKAYYLDTQQDCPVRPIHRLDFETTGLVIFCKLPFFQPLLDDMLAHKKIRRQYYAIVDGIVKEPYQSIDASIARDRHDAKKMRVSSDGKHARTSVHVKKVYPHYTWVECHLETGRTHQIRIHLAHVHHPLLADSLYGTPSPYINRLALHAFEVKLFHPLLQEELCINCELPDDMKKLLK